MKLIILSSETFAGKDKREWAVVYGMSEKQSVVKMFMPIADYQNYGFQKVVLDKSDVENLYKNYKAVDVQFDATGKIDSVSSIEE